MPDWSKRKRLEATISGEKPDRPPVALWRHFPGDDQDAASLAAAHLQWQRDYDWDLLKVSPANSFCVADWGVRSRWEGTLEGTRTITRRAVERPEDWEKLRLLDPGTGALAVQIEGLHLLEKELGEETPTLATIFSPLSQAKNLAGQERMLSHMRAHPDSFERGLEAITRSTIAYIEAAGQSGISGIFYAVQHANYALTSPAEYERFGRPYDLRILAAAGDLWLNMLHLHGAGEVMFEQVARYPVQIVNWHDRDTGLTLAEGMEQTDSAVSGGVSRGTLYQDSPRETIAEAGDALAQTGGRRHLLGIGCVAVTNTPLANIRALREAVEIP
jgi:uroporphyrinogen decarboxylase